MLNFGHRGFSGLYPENTNLSFNKAVEIGADGIECDLRMTKDGVLVLFHDDDLQRLCGKTGSIESTRWNELSKLKVKSEEPIARIESLFEMLPPEFQLNIEIKKRSFPDPLTKRLSAVFSRFLVDHPGKITISSFSAECLRSAHQALQEFSEVDFAIILDDWESPDFLEIQESSWITRWNIKFSCLSTMPSSLRPKEIWLWTLNDEKTWKQSLESDLPVTGIITDYPDRLRAFLDSLS
jgi:glycerophosphoryl diester phosphodiesterase